MAVFLLVPLCFASVFFGAAHVWSQSILVLSIFVLAAAGLWGWVIRRARSSDYPARLIVDSASLAGILFLAWTAFQLLPLPEHFLQILSPRTREIWESTLALGGNPPFPLSLYPYMTQKSLIFGAALLFFYWLAIYRIKSRRAMRVLILGLILLGTAMGLYALIQAATGQQNTLWWKRSIVERVASGTFIDRNHLAGFLSMILCLGIGYFWALGGGGEGGGQGVSFHSRMEGWERWIGKGRIIVLMAVALMMAALLATASRGGALSLLAGLIFMVALILARFFKKRNAYVVIMLLAVVCIYVAYAGAERVLERFQYFEAGFKERMILAQATLEMGKSFPHTGTGLGTFEFIFPGFQNYLLDYLIDYAHNDWAQLFAETGWPGLLILGGGFGWFLVSSISLWRKRRDPFSVGIGLGGMGAAVCIAVHSLSEFNLHLPANALVLALILALVHLSLHSEVRLGREKLIHRQRRFRIPLWAGIPLAGIATLGIGMMAQQVLQVWRADSLARTVWNSTLPFVPPTDRELKEAWALAPGNAAYWAWMAQRGVRHLPLDPNKPPTIKDPEIWPLQQGILRNPTSWAIWRQLGWTAFFKRNNDPNFYPALARKAFDQVRSLRPYASQGHLESGIIRLAAYARDKKDDSWKKDFRRTLLITPALAPKVLDQLILYLGRRGAGEIRGLLPGDAQSSLWAGEYLLKQGFPEAGLPLLKEGETKRLEEVEQKLAAFHQETGEGFEERKKKLAEIILLDPQNPPALLAKGELIAALKSQEQRGGALQDLGHLREMAWGLSREEQTKQGPPWEIAYFLGRIAQEEGDLAGAQAQLKKAVNLNPQYFPAWIHLREILARGSRTAGDLVELESLERKIRLFEMERIVSDAWRWGGLHQGWASWRAAFRSGIPLRKMEIRFFAPRPQAWSLTLDGVFVTAWAGASWNEAKKIKLPAGEHVFRLVQFGKIRLEDRKQLPFGLEIHFQRE